VEDPNKRALLAGGGKFPRRQKKDLVWKSVLNTRPNTKGSAKITKEKTPIGQGNGNQERGGRADARSQKGSTSGKNGVGGRHNLQQQGRIIKQGETFLNRGGEKNKQKLRGPRKTNRRPRRGGAA